MMAIAVRISSELVAAAKTHARAYHRSMAGQIEYWAKIGRIAEENPELPFSFIQDILLSLEELKVGEVEPYKFTKDK